MLLFISQIFTVTTAKLKRFSLLFSLIVSFLLLNLNPAVAQVSEKSITYDADFQSQDLYYALTAEIYNQFGDEKLAVDYYYKLSTKNNDAAIAKRVTELATVTGQIAKALDGAKRWVELKPNDLEANQYLSLLYLRNSRFKSSAKQLHRIRKLIEKTAEPVDYSEIEKDKFVSNESLTFVGAMLAAEAHHKKALMVFKLFLQEYASKVSNHTLFEKQQKLITAELAMKAKEYTEVINALAGLTGLDPQNYLDSTVMRAKAFHKLHKNEEAIQQLKTIQNHPQVSDSHRLELVRLLVLTQQKEQALPILEALVSRHAKNFDLLKSLVALQIDQSKMSKALKNINILRENDEYTDEADYFAGEFAEKLGQLEKALQYYEKVNTGSYRKNAQKKRISLTKKIHGEKALTKLFATQQLSARNLKSKSNWLKLQADYYFESRQYVKALKLYSRALELTPDNLKNYYWRGLSYERLGQLEKAETDFNYVLSKQGNHTETLNAFGYMLSVHTKRFKEAKTLIDKAYRLKPHDPLIMDSLGFVLFKIGDFQTAEKHLRKAYQMIKTPEVASHLISVLAGSNQHQEARRIFNEMKRLYPESPSLKSVSHYLP